MGPSDPTDSAIANLRLLVVDDCEANVKLAAALCKKLGVATVSAASGREAIERLSSEPFDAVLMDCGLPDIDGYEATRRIRAGAAGAARSRVPIVAFTADSDDETLRRCREAGMERALAKPIAVPALRSLIASLRGGGSDAPELHARIDSGELALFDAIGLLERVLNDRDIAEEVLEGFLEGLPDQIESLYQAIEQASCQKSASIAHQLKGAAGGVGGLALRQLATEIEAASHAGDVEAMRRLARSLRDASRRFQEAVRSVDLSVVVAGRGQWTPTDHSDEIDGCSLLLVEDDPTLRAMLTRMAEREGCRVVAVACAAEAKRAVEGEGSRAFDCMITDYRMPGESGLELLTWLRGHDADIAALIMTADDERSIVTSSLRKGACDFLEKPVDARRLLTALRLAVARTREQRSMKRAQCEVASIGATQTQMLLAQAECSLPIELCFHPKLDAGGDFFSRFPLSATRIFCLLTDVSGHDLQAAYLSAYFHGMARGMLERSAEPPQLFDFFNRYLVREWNGGSPVRPGERRALASVAIASLLLDTERGTIEAITAGAPAPSRCFEDGRISVVGDRGGAPLGWFEECPATTHRSSFEGGGSLLLWSDGLDELAQANGVCVLAAAFAIGRAHRSGSAHPLVSTAGDDILLARVSLPPHQDFESSFAPLVLWRYRGDQADEIDSMVEYWRKSLRLAIADLSDAAEHDILLATREAMLNALEHGCCSLAHQRATLQICYRPADRTVRVIIEDPGPGHSFDHAAYANRAADELLTAHRGLMFIHYLATAVRYERNGAVIFMDFDLGRTPG